jgi:hypothetical protein
MDMKAMLNLADRKEIYEETIEREGGVTKKSGKRWIYENAKHASPGVTARDWFYFAVGVGGMAALQLALHVPR